MSSREEKSGAEPEGPARGGGTTPRQGPETKWSTRKIFKMQIAIHTLAPGDSRALEDLNKFMRGHRVLTIDKACHAGVWSVCETYVEGAASAAKESRRAPKIDYREVLNDDCFKRFAQLRDLRKKLAEEERLPAYAVFTNEELAEIAKARCAMLADLGKIEGIGPARVEKYGEAVLTHLRDNHETV